MTFITTNNNNNNKIPTMSVALLLLLWTKTTMADTAPVGLECNLCGPDRVLRSPLPTGGHYCDDLAQKGQDGVLTFEECATSQTELRDFCCIDAIAAQQDPPDDPLPEPDNDVCNICNVGSGGGGSNVLLRANPSFECEMDYLRGMAGLLDLDECMDRQYSSIAEQCCQSNGVSGNGGGADNDGVPPKDAIPPPNMMYPVCHICGTYPLQDPLTSECGDYRRQGEEGMITPQTCDDYRHMLVGECCVVHSDSEDPTKLESDKESSSNKKKPTLQRALLPILALVAVASVVVGMVLRRCRRGGNQKEVIMNDNKGGEVELGGGNTSSSSDGSDSDEESNDKKVDVGDQHKVVV